MKQGVMPNLDPMHLTRYLVCAKVFSSGRKKRAEGGGGEDYRLE